MELVSQRTQVMRKVVGLRSDRNSSSRQADRARLIYAAAAAQLLVLSVLAAPLVGQDPMGPSGFRLGVASEYVVAKGFLSDDLKNGVGVRLYTDFRLSSVWTFQFSFIAGRFTGRRGWPHISITETGEPAAPPDIGFSALGVKVGPRVRKGVVNDRFGVIAGVDLGVSQFGEMSQVSRAYLAGVVVGGETRLFKNVWLTMDAAADVIRATESFGGHEGGQLFSFRLGCAIPF